jgi:hypothetical protein
MSRKCQKKKHLFLNWLKANRNRFRLIPRVIRHQKNSIVLNFIGISSSIRMLLYPDTGITVSVFWQGKVWDFIGDFDVAVQKSESGYYCALCNEEHQSYYPTREALILQHCFEQFLEWSNSELADMKWLVLHESSCGTSAKLNQEKPSVEDGSATHIISLYLK